MKKLEWNNINIPFKKVTNMRLVDMWGHFMTLTYLQCTSRFVLHNVIISTGIRSLWLKKIMVIAPKGPKVNFMIKSLYVDDSLIVRNDEELLSKAKGIVILQLWDD